MRLTQAVALTLLALIGLSSAAEIHYHYHYENTPSPRSNRPMRRMLKKRNLDESASDCENKAVKDHADCLREALAKTNLHSRQSELNKCDWSYNKALRDCLEQQKL